MFGAEASICPVRLGLGAVAEIGTRCSSATRRETVGARDIPSSSAAEGQHRPGDGLAFDRADALGDRAQGYPQNKTNPSRCAL